MTQMTDTRSKTTGLGLTIHPKNLTRFVRRSLAFIPWLNGKA
ncbi:hypothetical protein [Planktothricoides raciborskii]|uniref:Uncharacterized protein n=1 Tax=Planktothricoides raciborskii GIHE-MW2 TaxID=2792601 RepID=A0AAU8JBG1_9CYAN